jgi:serine/threonine-protein kinase mTOR
VSLNGSLIVISLCFSHLAGTMQHLLICLRSRDKDRVLAFTTIGLIAVAVESEINPYLPKIMEVVKGALPAKVVNLYI